MKKRLLTIGKLFAFGSALIFTLITLSASQPEDDLQGIIQRLETYYKNYPQVRVHLIFNQPKYSPGDTAFFKAYFLTEDFRPIPDKQILTIELKDESENIVHAQNIRVVDGAGSNQVIFSSSLVPGVYDLVAYSEVMKNLDQRLFFKKRIPVVGRKQLVSQKKVDDNIGFYPEGGSLVEGVENNVVVESSRPGTGKILDQTGMLAAEFQIGNDGITSFSFTPKKGFVYTLDWMGNQNPLEFTDDASALHVRTLQAGVVDIDVDVTPESPLAKQDLYFVALSKGRIVYSATLKPENGKANVSISTLFPGLNQFFLFDKKDKLLAERIYYVTPSSALVQIDIDPEAPAPRDVISLNVAITDEAQRPVPGSFVTRAINASLFEGGRKVTLETELNLFSDLPDLQDRWESSSLTEEEWKKQLDARLIAQKWLRIDWNEVLRPSKDKIKYTYKYSLDLKGKAMFKSTGEPVPDSTLILIYQQRAMVGYETRANKKGEFTFPFLYDFTGTDQAFYMMDFIRKEKQPDYVIVPELRITDVNNTKAFESDLSDPYGDYRFKKNLIDRSFTFFNDPNKNAGASNDNPNLEFEDELGGADVTVKVDDYLVFPTMADLIHEVISGLQHRTVGGTSIVRVVFIRNTYTVIPKGDPLYIIDGVFTKNTDYFLKLNPEEILSIKLVNDESKLQRFGGMGKYGIVIVQTKKSLAKEVVDNSTVFSISGLSPELSFQTTVHANVNRSRRPDLRSCIYWNPGHTTNSTGKAQIQFSVSDDAAPLTIEVLGFTTDGRSFSSTKRIEVRAPEIRP